ncbi:MAG: CBS domain-containing protein [Candidatus Tritonobacter lacicola]|nr:CBS domain-containing protein [Candidatus Tritonobacter lacicola]
MVTAADIMTREVVTIQAEAPLREALSKLVKNKISGMPVVNQENEIVGIITEKDMLNFILSGSLPQTVVKEAMVKEVVCFPPDTPYEKLCLSLIEHNFRRIPIVAGKKVVGLVARRDLLRGVSRFYSEK